MMHVRLEDHQNAYSSLKELLWTAFHAVDTETERRMAFIAHGPAAQTIEDLGDGANLDIEADLLITLVTNEAGWLVNGVHAAA